MIKHKTLSSKVASPSMNASLVTRNMVKVVEPTGNVYQSINILGKRSRQVNTAIKEELVEKLSEFNTAIDNLEEIHENREQIEISKFYERLPRPSTIATEEFLAGKVFWRRTEDLDNGVDTTKK
ncbi:MAG: DNA-directed RNA polymerase subunit omega [Flexibacteraceae bacterium]|jgi:DNA-directed RNA polymerase subunit K/omega